MSSIKYKRVMLKLSGEVLAGANRRGLDFAFLGALAHELVEISKEGVEIAIVIGGGNIWRYRDNQEAPIERTASDYLGMMATIMNSVALQAALIHAGARAKVFSALPLPQLAEDYLIKHVKEDLEKNVIVLCAGGTGSPFFTTDSAAALRALELQCDLMMKASNVDFLYDSDPNQNPEAKPFHQISYQEVLEKNLQVMDMTAISLCKEHSLPIAVFNLKKTGNIAKVIKGQSVGTIVN